MLEAIGLFVVLSNLWNLLLAWLDTLGIVL